MKRRSEHALSGFSLTPERRARLFTPRTDALAFRSATQSMSCGPRNQTELMVGQTQLRRKFFDFTADRYRVRPLKACERQLYGAILVLDDKGFELRMDLKVEPFVTSQSGFG
jgi:hypothetical protein